jgi:hypothetical protein
MRSTALLTLAALVLLPSAAIDVAAAESPKAMSLIQINVDVSNPLLPISRYLTGMHFGYGSERDSIDSILHGFNRPDLYPREVSPVGHTAPNRVSGRVFQAALDQRLTSNLSFNLGYSHDALAEKAGGYNGTPGILR